MSSEDGSSVGGDTNASGSTSPPPTKVAAGSSPSSDLKASTNGKSKADDETKTRQEPVVLLSDSDLSDVDDEIEVLGDPRENAARKLNQRIKNSTSDPHPKHRWETAYVYAFIDRFTFLKDSSIYAPQTIFEFEQALLHGGAPAMPESLESEWIPSLEPIVKDLTDRVKAADVAKGGTGGMRGGWQLFVPWWINDQRNLGLPDFEGHAWGKTVSKLKEDKDNGFYSLDWDKKLIILKAFVDNILCFSPEVHAFINECYGVTFQGKKPGDKEAKERLKEMKESKKDEKGKGKEKAKESTIAASNPLLFQPIGKDAAKRLWYRVDDSPRLYILENPIRPTARWTAVSQNMQDLEDLLSGLSKPPAKKAANDVFAKSKKSNGVSDKQRWQIIEQNLHAHIRDVVLADLQNPEGIYESRLAKVNNRRSGAIRKRDKEIRAAVLANEREAQKLQGYENSSLRMSTRLRRGRQPDADGRHGYSELSYDQAVERAIKENEAGNISSDSDAPSPPRKRLRRSSRREDDDEEGGEYTGPGSDDDENEEADLNDDDVDEDDERSGARRSSRRSNGRHSIPGERRSGRTRNVRRSSSPPPLKVRAGPTISRSYSPASHEDLQSNAPVRFGVEEIWSMNKYKGYHMNGVFHKAQKGDVPPYRLAQLGLPLPGEPGYSRTGKPEDAEGADAANGEGEGKAPESARESPSVPGSAVPTLENGEGPTDESMITSEGEEQDDQASSSKKQQKADTAYMKRVIQSDDEGESSGEEDVVRVASAPANKSMNEDAKKDQPSPPQKKAQNFVLIV